MRNTIANTVWTVSWFICAPLAKSLGLVKVIHRDAKLAASKRPMILAANHQGILDPWLISISLPFRIFWRLLPIRPFAVEKFIHKSDLLTFLRRTGLLRVLYYLHNVITLPAGRELSEKVAPLIIALRGRESILIFPEGRINRQRPREFKRGVVEIHRQTGTPILPFALYYEKGGWLSRRVRIAIGAPFSLPAHILERDKEEEIYQLGAMYIQDQITELYNGLVEEPQETSTEAPQPLTVPAVSGIQDSRENDPVK